MNIFWYFLFSFLQAIVEYFGWWIAFGVIWYNFDPDLGTKAVLVTGFGALVCFVGIRILLNRLY